jgi:subfamily B ATP-binding cassette protein MsbA
MKFPVKEFNFVLSRMADPAGFYRGLTAAIGAAAISSIIPYIYGRLVDLAVRPDFPVSTIALILVAWLILSFIGDSLSRFSERKSYEISTDEGIGLIVDIFRRLIDLPLKFHKEKKMGKVMRRIDRGLDDLAHMLENTLFSFLPSFISFFFALVILFLVEWRLALILLFSSVVYVWITFRYTRDILAKQKLMHRKYERAYGDLFDSVINAQAVKAATAEEFEYRRNKNNFEGANSAYKNYRAIWQKMSFWQRLVFSFSFVLAFGLGMIMLRSGSMSPGKLIMFVGYIGLLTAPLSRVAEQYRIIKTGLFSFRRALKYYSLAPEKDARNAVDLEGIRGEVEFKDVGFYYKKGHPVLSGINFRVEPGQAIAFVGASGVGKTTLVDLIGRYYLPTSGRIYIDGVDVRRIKLKSLRNQMAIVPQEVLLFNDTIKRNIAYASPGIAEEKIVAAAKAANADEFISKLPKGYDQLVGERGVKLSGGQKQRVAIARAILRDPRILILDEATSSLDSASEKLVQEALNRLIRGRTTFIIAHRLSTIQRADKIVVLEKGRIAEMGTHEELMKNPTGIYRNFWEMQSAMSRVD